MDIFLIRLVVNMIDPVIIVAILIANFVMLKQDERILKVVSVAVVLSLLVGVLLGVPADALAPKVIASGLSAVIITGIFVKVRPYEKSST
jgi:hypothetical protein